MALQARAIAFENCINIRLCENSPLAFMPLGKAKEAEPVRCQAPARAAIAIRNLGVNVPL
jgi:hypothetical protein